MDEYSRVASLRLDHADPLAHFRDRFHFADADTLYLDGNSLGRMPARTPEFLAEVLTAGWGAGLVRSWTEWIDWGRRLGDLLAEHVLGARSGEVVLADSTSVNLYKLAAAALDAVPQRRTIVFDPADFPTNRYVLQGLASDRGLRTRPVHSDPVHGVDPAALAEVLDTDVALVVLSLVSYGSGALLDQAAVQEAADRYGALVLWDLSHAAGAVPVRLRASGSQLAVGCTYKYLNGGPGAPAFLYVREDLQTSLRQPIWGWFGQRDQFLMGSDYQPVDGIERFLVGTPPVLSLAALRPAVELFAEAGVDALRDKGIRLTELVIALADEWLAEFGVTVASPRDPARRGGHVSLHSPVAWQLCQALMQHGIICDYRDPGRLRIAPVPLYTRFTDVWDALSDLRSILADREYERFPSELSRVT